MKTLKELNKREANLRKRLGRRAELVEVSVFIGTSSPTHIHIRIDEILKKLKNGKIRRVRKSDNVPAFLDRDIGQHLLTSAEGGKHLESHFERASEKMVQRVKSIIFTNNRMYASPLTLSEIRNRALIGEGFIQRFERLYPRIGTVMGIVYPVKKKG